MATLSEIIQAEDTGLISKLNYVQGTEPVTEVVTEPVVLDEEIVASSGE